MDEEITVLTSHVVELVERLTAAESLLDQVYAWLEDRPEGEHLRVAIETVLNATDHPRTQPRE
jgi:hypothetical protein